MTVARTYVTLTHMPVRPHCRDRLKGIPTDAAIMGCPQCWSIKEEGDALSSFHFENDQLFGCSHEEKPEKHKELT